VYVNYYRIRPPMMSYSPDVSLERSIRHPVSHGLPWTGQTIPEGPTPAHNMVDKDDALHHRDLQGAAGTKQGAVSARELSSRERAARLLVAPAALMQLSLTEAKIVVSYMRPEQVSAGETFITEGDADNTGFMVLLLDGEVVVESITVSRSEPVTTAVLGPGSLVGEMGLLDTGPRSASCTASTDIQCAVLTRQALESLIEEQPGIGAKFLLAVSARIAERYRDTQKKLKLFARLAATMQQELDKGA